MVFKRRSLGPSDSYMRQLNIQSLVQIMACRLIGTKPLPEPMLSHWWVDTKGHISMKFYSKFIQGNTLENVICKMAAILSRCQCVKNNSFNIAVPADGLASNGVRPWPSSSDTIVFKVFMVIDSNWLTCGTLTHWGRVTHICVGTPTIFGSDNGLSPGRRQAII